MGSQDVKRFETLLKLAWQYFSRIVRYLRKKMSSKNSLLVVSEILRLFVNILTPDEKCSLLVKANV